MVQERDDIVGLDAGILMHPQVWVTSGHVGSFSDPLVECLTDHKRFRLDELPGAENLTRERPAWTRPIVERLGLRCPDDGGPLSAPRRFNLMFKTFMGPVEEDAAVIYLRPETAQGSYVNFKNVQQSSRKKLPFGIAQIGKSFRNEISPGNFVFRMREFEQMEMQYFVRPDEAAAEAFEMWLPKRRAWYEQLRRHARAAAPARARARRAGPLREEGGRRRIPLPVRLEGARGRPQPRRLRPVAPLRGTPARSSNTSTRRPTSTSSRGSSRPPPAPTGPPSRSSSTPIARRRSAARRASRWPSIPDLAPYKVAVLPLLKKRPEIVELCHRIKDDLKRHTMAVYDDTAAIGKLYRRQDEIGTPWCVTVDVDSLEDGAVTVRDRDSMAQERIPVEGVTRLILDRLEAARRTPDDVRGAVIGWSGRASPRGQLTAAASPREPFRVGRRHTIRARHEWPRRTERVGRGPARARRASAARRS